jgi:hypothetical protein
MTGGYIHRLIPTQSLTVTVNPVIPQDCVVFLPGGAVFAGGLSALQFGRPISPGPGYFPHQRERPG